MTTPHPAYNWHEVTRLALISRLLDELEESELSPQGLVTYQFSARGHELGQILVSQLLGRPFDAGSVYYRSRPFMLGVGLTAEEALASDMARLGSVSAGRDVGVVFNLPYRGKATVLPAGGDVGSQFTPAAGWAQAIQYRIHQLGETDLADSIAVVFGGDGSVATNGFWSALTIATTLKLPLLFVIEDNGYAISVTSPLQTPGANIAQNLAAFQNLHIWDGSGTNPAETATLVYEAVNYVRSGQGAALLRLTVPRLSGHSSVDNQAYKTEEIRAAEWARDPIPALRHYLNYAEEDWNVLYAEAQAVVQAARQAAQAQPEDNPTTINRFAFYEPGSPQQVGGLLPEGVKMPAGNSQPIVTDPRRINFVEAIRRTIEVELEQNPRLLLLGEDVGEKGGVHAATLGLQKRFGKNRVFDTSLSEEGIIGRSVGMALAGLFPVPEIQFRKYADPATEQIHNAGTLRWRTNNRFAVPFIIRIPGGYRKIGDPWHSVTSEIDFAHAVGLKVAFPSNAEDGIGLLRTALRGHDPVIFFEHRAVLDAGWSRRAYPGDQFVLPFGKGKIITPGSSLTLVTWGAMVERCEAAANELDVEIIDLRTIQPWDEELVLDSVRKTSKCLIVHEDMLFGGFGAEIAATVVAKAFMDLDAPIERIAPAQIPVPFSTTLMDGMIPRLAQIRQRIEYLIAY